MQIRRDTTTPRALDVYLLSLLVQWIFFFSVILPNFADRLSPQIFTSDTDFDETKDQKITISGCYLLKIGSQFPRLSSLYFSALSGHHRLLLTECLFDPLTVLDLPCPGVGEAGVRAVLSSPLPLRRTMVNNVIVCGGLCKIEGFVDRIALELRNRLPEDIANHVRIIGEEDGWYF
jgi:hypothetical protein